MSTSIMIHTAKNVIASTVSHSNANAITLTIVTHGDDYEVVLFNLPAHIADGIYELLGDEGIKHKMSEADIRADERRKIADELRYSF